MLGCRAAAAGDPAGAVRRITVADGMRARAGVARHAYLAQLVGPAAAGARTRLGRQAERIAAGAHCLRAREALDDDAGPTLTAREDEVARLVAEGFTNRRIGHALGISERTVERHLDHIRGKIGSDSRTGVALWVVSGAVSGSADTAGR